MAGKRPTPRFRASKYSWFVTIGGQQIRLGRDEDEAFRQFHRLMAERRPDLVANPTVTVQ